MRPLDRYQILLQGLVRAEFTDLTIWLLRMLCWSQSITGGRRDEDKFGRGGEEGGNDDRIDDC